MLHMNLVALQAHTKISTKSNFGYFTGGQVSKTRFQSTVELESKKLLVNQFINRDIKPLIVI